jgi:hypothetical protein
MVKEIVLGYSHESNDYARTISLKLRFHNDEISEWYRLRCERDQTPPCYTIQRLHTLIGDTSNPEALKRIRGRYEECRKSHSSTTRSGEIPIKTVPSRILDLGSPMQKLNPNSIIRLRETNEDVALIKPYVAISWRWGSPRRSPQQKRTSIDTELAWHYHHLRKLTRKR